MAPDPCPARTRLGLLGPHQEDLQLVSSIQMKQAGSQMRLISARSGSGGARRGSRSQIEVCVNDSSNSLSRVVLTARLSWINWDAHSRPGIWFQMEHKSGRWNVQFCCSLGEAYWGFEPVLLHSFHFLPCLSHNCGVDFAFITSWGYFALFFKITQQMSSL